ncbi:CHAD domain-containing protein [Singulisphaera sp. PoT]|uniref:CHAD domain-containing protein n=1 Tax=Singulisphaera sp. PoT TaxID=3411797 RepID=UPI003BF51915
MEGMHKMRATTRRLRSELRFYEEYVDPEWAFELEEDLKWLASKLGLVRQFDVLRDRFRASAGSLESSIGPIFQTLGERRARAALELQCVIDGIRYEDLWHRLQTMIEHPTYEDSALAPCREIIPDLVADAWKKLKKKARKLKDSSEDEDFHDVRKRAKRARYAAEAVAKALPSARKRDALRFAVAATHIQDILGEHQDAADAIHFIQDVASEFPDDGAFNLAAGRMIERETYVLDTSRDKFFEAWKPFDHRKNRRWFHS